jgi:hypothetical protein
MAAEARAALAQHREDFGVSFERIAEDRIAPQHRAIFLDGIAKAEALAEDA